jgi:transposase
VNAAHIKAVPERKTDVRDCEWIADLLAHGPLKGSFVPHESIRGLRDLTRYRKSLIDERARVVNRLHKLLETANIKLTSVATDVMGVSAQAMLGALLEGTTDPEVLAHLARGKLRTKLPEPKKALKGRFRDHHRLMLSAILSHIEFLDEAISHISEEVAMRILPFRNETEMLDMITGLNQRTVEVVISEIGVDMSRFTTDRHLASWAGVCPGNNESAGKRKTGNTRKGNIWLRRALIQAAQFCIRTDTYLAAQYHRLVPRRGTQKATMAVAHSILVIIYHVLKDKVPYQDLGSDYFSRINRTHVERHHIRRLESLGYKVHLEPLEAAA